MIKMIPEGWVKIKLGDIGKFSTSSVDKKSIEGEEEVCMLNYMDIYNHSTLTEDYPFEKVTAPRKQVLSSSVQRGDVFFTPSSETPDDIGHSAVFIGDLENIVHSYHTIRFRSVSNEYLDDHFKSHVFQGVDTYEYFRKRASGSTRFTLSLPVFNELELTVPSLPEQKKIASILNSVDEVIEKTQSKINKLQDLKKGMMNELLTKGIGHTEFKDSELGRIPKSWEVKKMNSISEVIDSLHETPSFSDQGIAMVRVTDIKRGFLNLTKTKKVTKDTFEKFIKKYRPSVGDIVMSRVGSYGISSFVETHEPFCMGQNTVVIHPKHINGRFLYECLNSKLIQKQIELEVAGSGYKSISLADIRALTIPIPPKKEQEVIQSTLLSIDDQTICQKQKLTQTQSLKKSLMQVLLTGKVRVKVN